MLHASVIMFSPRVWGVGSHVSLKITCKQVPLAEMSVQTCMGYSLIFLPDAFPLFPYTHTLFSHTSLQQFQDLGKTIRKLPKSFLILRNCSGFRAKLFLHLFFFKFLKKTHLEFPLYFFALLCILFLPVFIEKRFLKPKMSSSIPIAAHLWFNWPGAG